MLPTVPGPVVEASTALETGEGEPRSTVPVGQKLIALILDGDLHRSIATRLLDGLPERGVKATSSLTRAQIENNGDVMRRIDEEGYQVGIYTFDHVKLTDLGRTDFDTQMKTTRALLKSTLGHSDSLLRPFYGMLDESIKTWVGCSTILWPIDPGNWRDQNTDQAVRGVVAGARDGRIIPMHDTFPGSVDVAFQIVGQLHQ